MTYEIYVHVPFCLRRCGYCDFVTFTGRDLGGGVSRASYADMAIAEMRLTRDWQLAHGIEEPPASTVFFGGGTPTILPAADLNRMLAAMRELWGIEPGAEITTEANPDTVDAAYIKELSDGGFTRISFGTQSAVPHVLRTLDRTHTPANVEAGVRAAEAAGLRTSVDLIYGAPRESLDDWRASVRAAIDLGVNHISAYALTVEPTTKMGRRIADGTLPRPDDDDEAAKYEIADELLSAAGLRWYEVSNWARPGYESRHNLGYWRNVDWAGIGPGAHSHYNVVAVPSVILSEASAESKDPRERDSSALPQNDRKAPHGDGSALNAGLRAWDIAHPKLWGLKISAGEVPWAGSETVTRNEDLEEHVMLALRIRDGLDIPRLEEAAGTGIDRGELRRMESEGLVDCVADNDGAIRRIVATRQGRLLNDMLIERFFDLLDL